MYIGVPKEPQAMPTTKGKTKAEAKAEASGNPYVKGTPTTGIIMPQMLEMLVLRPKVTHHRFPHHPNLLDPLHPPQGDPVLILSFPFH
jgi:hypothetical protein